MKDKTVLVSVRVPVSVKANIDRTAEAADRTLSYLVRQALVKTYGPPAELQPQN